jgi:hypothetical protein
VDDRHGSGQYYVALFHAIDAVNHFTAFAYKFQAHPPFSILAVSARLPLQLPDLAHASDLTFIGDKVVVTYRCERCDDDVVLGATWWELTGLDNSTDSVVWEVAVLIPSCHACW